MSNLLETFLRAPSFCPALVVMCEMCFVQVSLQSNVIPRIPSSGFTSSWQPPRLATSCFAFRWFECDLPCVSPSFHLGQVSVETSCYRVAVFWRVDWGVECRVISVQVNLVLAHIYEVVNIDGEQEWSKNWPLGDRSIDGGSFWSLAWYCNFDWPVR